MKQTGEESMAHVVEREELPHSATAHRFEGHLYGGANISFFLIDAPMGEALTCTPILTRRCS
jgi:hypothetical protein